MKSIVNIYLHSVNNYKYCCIKYVIINILRMKEIMNNNIFYMAFNSFYNEPYVNKKAKKRAKYSDFKRKLKEKPLYTLDCNDLP